MPQPPIRRTRTLLREQLRSLTAHPPIRLRVGDPRDFPDVRNFAMCGFDGAVAEIIVAPKIEREPDAVIVALLRHEIAHAVLMSEGIEHRERDADTLAEEIWGDPIYYDARDVETLAGGVRPRPGYLPR